ncbi:hypothetical protein H5410_062846 [Solanum commersonii]|uniref:Uncharacterized protein n=1 Tax=Solanum commersonii TaxID=4109 RepID=A0A9J5WDI7_SOLCO|nr:hypothetical protein H5410_062846 [Solanum commersonii]
MSSKLNNKFYRIVTRPTLWYGVEMYQLVFYSKKSNLPQHVIESDTGAASKVKSPRNLGFKRGRGRPKKYYGEVIRQDMARFQLSETITLDRRVWRTQIRIEVNHVDVRKIDSGLDYGVRTITMDRPTFLYNHKY